MKKYLEKVKQSVFKFLDITIKNKDDLDLIEKASYIILVIFVAVFGFLTLVFLVIYSILGVSTVVFMNTINLILVALNLYILKDTKNIRIGVYLITLNYCFYCVFSTYVWGYHNNAVMLLPIWLLILNTIFPKWERYLVGSTILTIGSYIIIIYIKYNVTSKYTEESDYVELINHFFAFGSIIYFVYWRWIVENIVSRYTLELNEVVEEANIDFLTGLWNRRFMESKFLETNFNESFIVFGDIDYFKKVNDTYGHSCGDYVIKSIAKALTEEFRNTDNVCRWGGEEFLIFVKNSKSLDIENRLNKFRKSISNKTFEYKEDTFNVTMTFGFSKVANKEDVNDAIEKADKALYYGKNSGRNRVVYYLDIKERDMK